MKDMAGIGRPDFLGRLVKRIKELRETLTHHAKLYYVYDAPEISDYDYDMMMRELSRLEDEFPELLKSNSPTHRMSSRPQAIPLAIATI